MWSVGSIFSSSPIAKRQPLPSFSWFQMFSKCRYISQGCTNMQPTQDCIVYYCLCAPLCFFFINHYRLFCHHAVLAFTLWCRFFHSIGEKWRVLEVMLPAQDATAELRLKSRSDAKPELFLLCWAASLKNWGTSIGLVIGSTWEKFGFICCSCMRPSTDWFPVYLK